jgi:hypothetical protein
VGTIPESTIYNPLSLECRCWAGRHDGLCSHIVAVNASKGKVDLKQALTPVDTPKRAGRKRKMHFLEK